MIERIAEYFQQEREVVAVYLFGSHASGMERRGSDLDLGIVFSGSDRDLMRRKTTQYMVELARVLAKEIHPVVMNGASQALLRQIYAKGHCILVNDRALLARFRMAQFSQIAEFGFYRRQIQEGFIREVTGGGSVGRR